eukprot:7233635-Pyramimonas_sp.AAC.1
MPFNPFKRRIYTPLHAVYPKLDAGWRSVARKLATFQSADRTSSPLARGHDLDLRVAHVPDRWRGRYGRHCGRYGRCCGRYGRCCGRCGRRCGHCGRRCGRYGLQPVIRSRLAAMAAEVEACHAWVEMLTYQLAHMPKDHQHMVHPSLSKVDHLMNTNSTTRCIPHSPKWIA